MLAPLLGLLLSLTNPSPLEFAHPQRVDPGSEAYLALTANEATPPLKVEISADGVALDRTVPAMATGGRHEIRWVQPQAQASYRVHVSGGGIDFTYMFDVGLADGSRRLDSTSTWEDLVKRRQITYTCPHPIVAYEWEVWDTDANRVDGGRIDGSLGAHQPFTVRWDSTAPLFMVRTRAFDETGGYLENRTVPWSVEIPHTEVHFDSGKWNIKPSEAHKLDTAIAATKRELAKLDKINRVVDTDVKAELYVVGYTDTVGTEADNQILSERRAKAIANYFMDHGIWLAIFYAGLGETAPAVPTADNVPEVRNRRALYLLGASQPAGGGAIPHQWQQLTGERARPASVATSP